MSRLRFFFSLILLLRLSELAKIHDLIHVIAVRLGPCVAVRLSSCWHFFFVILRIVYVVARYKADSQWSVFLVCEACYYALFRSATSR